MDDTAIFKYLTDNPDLIDKFLQRKLLYHVCFRSEDMSTNDTIAYSDIRHLATFVSKTTAYDWVMKYGPEIVYQEERERNTPIVIIVIANFNDIEDYTHIATYYLGTAHQKYRTFSFSESGYNMCLREHKIMALQNYFWIIPYWLSHHHDTETIYGCKLDHIHDINNNIKLSDETAKDDALIEYHKLQSDPKTYIFHGSLGDY